MSMKAISILLVVFSVPLLAGESKPKPVERQTAKCVVYGLFSPDREAEFRAVVKRISGMEITALDYDTAEMTFTYDPTIEFFREGKPGELYERLDNRLRGMSFSTFGMRAPLDTPPDKMKRIEIPVGGLDCKGCALGAYWTVYRIDGVARATVNFKEGWLRATIDPAKTSREALIAAMRKKEGLVVKEK